MQKQILIVVRKADGIHGAILGYVQERALWNYK